ncbi:hypothetical protein PHJA_001301100 [Phtheirospermum japonicum]|uniref:Wall-associated receptor kinase galacturonan-binding domain-containing protein n=1 Tax=Phtheirospermum japonicum TaxID=374723 RepID=A0A830CBF0_9LAMI|nr:hypothetical protein PHJA_001301100 [Phtheirospermum japonicum]
MNPSIITLISSILITFLPTLTSSQTCQSTCGKLPIKYPFGTGPGCGDPRFQPYVTCTQQQQLTLSTHTGCYTITSIDYNNQVVHISDPTMSTCSCTRPSPGFGLNWDAPFTFHDTTVFALLDCSTTSSPIYKGNYGNNSTFPMCDSQGADICGLLNSCDAISRLSLPISTCCVYTPVDLGPSFEMDLGKLQCASYSAVYGYNGQESNPEGWEYGIALKYKFNYKNDYPDLCASCEKSNGVCGYDCGPNESFACNCPGGLNTTTDCFFGQPWNFGSRVFPWKIGTFSVFSLTWFIILAFV